MQYQFTEIGERQTEIELGPDEIRCSIKQPGFQETDFMYKYEELRAVSLDKQDPQLCIMKWQFPNGSEVEIPNRSLDGENSNAVLKRFHYRKKEFRDLYEALQARLVERNLETTVKLSIGSPARFVMTIIGGLAGLSALIFALSHKMNFGVIGILALGLAVGYQILGPTMSLSRQDMTYFPDEILEGDG